MRCSLSKAFTQTASHEANITVESSRVAWNQQAEVNNFFFETEDVFQEERFFTLGKALGMQTCWNTTRHHITSLFNRFCKIFQPENVANKHQFPWRSSTHFLRLSELHGPLFCQTLDNFYLFWWHSGGQKLVGIAK